jgi:HK97 family phage major capsid protein
LNAIDGLREANEVALAAQKKDMAALQDRLEEIESKAGSPGKTVGAAKPRREWKTFHTAHGEVHELPASVKMADVLPAQEAPVSFDRWLAAAMGGERIGDKEALEFAREQKQLVTTTTGMLIPEQFQSQWIDLIRSQMVLNAAGMTTVTMTAKTLNASAVVTDPAANWHTEAGSINVDNPTFAARTMTAQTLVVRCQGSLEVSQDCPDFGAQLAGVMARAMAVELDRVGLVGSGTPPEPRGVGNTSGRSTVTNVGVITDYSEMIQAVGHLLDNNVPLEVATANAIMSPGVWANYENLATGISSDKTQLPRPRSLESTRFRVTTNGLDVPESSPENSPGAVTSTIFMGDFRDLVLGVRREASVEALKLATYGTNLLLEFVGYLRADYMVRRPSSFVTLEDISAGEA